MAKKQVAKRAVAVALLAAAVCAGGLAVAGFWYLHHLDLRVGEHSFSVASFSGSLYAAYEFQAGAGGLGVSLATDDPIDPEGYCALGFRWGVWFDVYFVGLPAPLVAVLLAAGAWLWCRSRTFEPGLCPTWRVRPPRHAGALPRVRSGASLCAGGRRITGRCSGPADKLD